MDEFTATLKARELISKVNPTVIPVPIEDYAAHVGAVLRPQSDLGADEPAWSFQGNGKHFICINSNDIPERQRFSVCHEIAHIALGIPSDHEGSPWWSYATRSPNEICCDVFAAELLLPHRLFKPFVDNAEVGLAAVDDLAKHFEASRTATGSRFAAFSLAPCAFVLSEQGKVRYSSRSTSLREANAWIAPRILLPPGSMSEKIRAGMACDCPQEVEADMWFSDWRRGGVLREDARHSKQWDQTLTLLWFEDEEFPVAPVGSDEEEEETGLKELDGVLPWPGKKRRK